MAKASATGVCLMSPPDIEQPGDGIEQGEEHGVRLLLLEQRLHVADLVLGASPGEFQTMRHDLGGGGFRPVPPDEVDEIGVHGRELDARLGKRLGQPLDLFDRVQCGIVAHRGALAELLGHPIRRLGLGRL